MPDQPTTKPFDITDGANRYEPCPACRRSFGMGLVTRTAENRNLLAVECDCGFRGDEVPTDGLSSSAADYSAFLAWNKMERRDPF